MGTTETFRNIEIRSGLTLFQNHILRTQESITGTVLANLRAVRLFGRVNKKALRESLAALICHYWILQRVDASGPVSGIPDLEHEAYGLLTEFDFQGLLEEERDERFALLVREQLTTPINLVNGPLMHSSLIQFGEEAFVFLLKVHQVAADEKSLGQLLSWILNNYELLAAGQQPPFTEPVVSFAEFVKWQRENLESGALRAQQEFWLRELEGAGAPQYIELPFDRPRPATTNAIVSIIEQAIPQRLSKNLDQFSNKSGSRPRDVLLAAFAIFLQRYSGLEDILVGSTVDHSSSHFADGVIGPVAKTVVFRIRVKHEATIGEIIDQVGETAARIKNNLDIPHEAVAEEFGVLSSGKHPTLASVMFSCSDDSGDPCDVAGLRVSPINLQSAISFYDLSVTVRKRGKAYSTSAAFSEELFERGSAERLLRHFVIIVGGMLSGNDQTVKDLPLCTDEERELVIQGWNQTDAAYPENACLHHLIDEQAARTPDSVAVAFQGTYLSYKKFTTKANQLADVLIEKGIKKGILVGVWMDRSLEQSLSLLAIMKAGAAYVPLDVNWPDERLLNIISDSGIQLVLTNSDAPNSPDPGVPCFRVDVDELDGEAKAPQVKTHPDEPLYVIYTSGSTGTPKGVINRHRGIINRLTHLTRRYGSHHDEAFLQTTAFIFDSSVEQLFWPLVNGGKTVVPPKMVGYDFDKILDAIETERVTFTDFVTSFFNVLVEHLANSEGHRKAFRSVREIIIGGEAANSKSLHQFKSIFPHVGVTNNYGPTETSIAVIEYEVPTQFVDPMPIGRPITNTHAFILDQAMNPVPIGVMGDLYISGVCVGLGYLNDEKKTREAFLRNPFPEFSGERMYRTGDKARYLPDGNILFLGRDDQQVKIRGVRIELWEIEAALLKHEKVREAVVLVREDTPGDKRLVGYILSGDTVAPTSLELREFLVNKLPESMVPGRFVMMDSFPLTNNGKVDRRALPEPEVLESGTTSYVPATTQMEIIISDIWKKELGLHKISLLDNFYDLGGDSLRATSVLVVLEDKTGLRIDQEEMLFQTLGQLAASCSERVPSTVVAERRSEGLASSFYNSMKSLFSR